MSARHSMSHAGPAIDLRSNKSSAIPVMPIHWHNTHGMGATCIRHSNSKNAIHAIEICRVAARDAPKLRASVVVPKLHDVLLKKTSNERGQGPTPCALVSMKQRRYCTSTCPMYPRRSAVSAYFKSNPSKSTWANDILCARTVHASQRWPHVLGMQAHSM